MNSTVDSLLGYHVRRVSSQSMANLAELLTPLNLRVTDVTVMSQINDSPNITSSEVGRNLGIRRANMTPLITALIHRGYLASTPIDGRSQGLSLTDEGRDVFNKAWSLIEQHEASYFSQLDEGEREQLRDLLSRVWS